MRCISSLQLNIVLANNACTVIEYRIFSCVHLRNKQGYEFDWSRDQILLGPESFSEDSITLEPSSYLNKLFNIAIITCVYL